MNPFPTHDQDGCPTVGVHRIDTLPTGTWAKDKDGTDVLIGTYGPVQGSHMIWTYDGGHECWDADSRVKA